MTVTVARKKVCTRQSERKKALSMTEWHIYITVVRLAGWLWLGMRMGMKSKWKTMFAQLSFIENHHTHGEVERRREAQQESEIRICVHLLHMEHFLTHTFQADFHLKPNDGKWKVVQIAINEMESIKEYRQWEREHKNKIRERVNVREYERDRQSEMDGWFENECVADCLRANSMARGGKRARAKKPKQEHYCRAQGKSSVCNTFPCWMKNFHIAQHHSVALTIEQTYKCIRSCRVASWFYPDIAAEEPWVQHLYRIFSCDKALKSAILSTKKKIKSQKMTVSCVPNGRKIGENPTLFGKQSVCVW